MQWVNIKRFSKYFRLHFNKLLHLLLTNNKCDHTQKYTHLRSSRKSSQDARHNDKIFRLLGDTRPGDFAISTVVVLLSWVIIYIGIIFWHLPHRRRATNQPSDSHHHYCEPLLFHALNSLPLLINPLVSRILQASIHLLPWSFIWLLVNSRRRTSRADERLIANTAIEIACHYQYASVGGQDEDHCK